MNRNINDTMRAQIKQVWRLSLPAILAQMTSIIMQYIDAGMVGKLTPEASASIGLVASSTWLLGGLCSSVAAGYSVQVAQLVGAKEYQRAKRVFKQAMVMALLLSVMLGTIGAGISFKLPQWLHGEAAICKDAAMYFLIYSCALPVVQMNRLIGNVLQCSGDMKTPSILSSIMCGLDVIFNAIFIFGLKLGVTGAALGTALSECIILFGLLAAVLKKSFAVRPEKGISWKPDRYTQKRAWVLGAPLALEHTALCGAMVLTTRIVAPLGSIAIAANSFAITAESLCYMPGYGIASAATTLVGQQIGAGNWQLAKRYAWMTITLGMMIMGIAGALMFVCCPWLMRLLSSSAEVQKLGAEVLRIEVFAEPLFAASIVASGALRGAGDTLVPSILNLVSMWGVRLTMSIILVDKYGLQGVWFAMCLELCVRGALYLVRVKKGKWLKAADEN